MTSTPLYEQSDTLARTTKILSLSSIMEILPTRKNTTKTPLSNPHSPKKKYNRKKSNRKKSKRRKSKKNKFQTKSLMRSSKEIQNHSLMKKKTRNIVKPR